jgi:hypothetical protein
MLHLTRLHQTAGAESRSAGIKKESGMKNIEFGNTFISLVPLAQAILCVDCERISEQSGGHTCAGCGSTHLINLAAVLNPVQQEEEIPA